MAKNRVPFRERLRTSKKILSEVLRFLRTERDLWVFPVLAALIFGVFLLPAILWGGRSGLTDGDLAGTLSWLLAFTLIGIPLMFLMSLLNTAFSFAAWGRMEGRRTTKREAWHRAVARSGVLFRFNVFAAVVGLVLALVGVFLEKLRFVPGLGRITGLLGSYGWALASFFVIPVIAVERERHAVGALQRSVSLVRQQFGTSVSGFVTIQLVLMLVFVPLMMIALIGVVFGAIAWTLRTGTDLSGILPVALAVAMVVPLTLMWVFQQALNTTYQTALYRFAVTKRINEPFTVDTLHSAWEPYRKA